MIEILLVWQEVENLKHRLITSAKLIVTICTAIV